ncbi:hypothetical protein NU195Hw_g3048t1 [Hortaea werneckii]
MGKTWNVEVPVDTLGKTEPGAHGYLPLNPRTETLPRGWNGFGRSLPCDIVVERDACFTVRDGVKLYADIYRPRSDTKVPAILCWSPFGKNFNGIDSLRLMTPWNLGIPDGTLSGLEKFEGLDPADWIPRGYAIVNIDSRGAFHSEGTMTIMGSQEAEDGYDVIEELALREWCTGDIGMAGNSHLAIAQWFIAALRPPHLKAMAPWEGCGDLYREQFARGGIYGGHLFDQLIQKHMLRGAHGIESFRRMYEKCPLANEWWNDKRPDMSQIDAPMYITGTWSNTMHGMGAIRAWMETKSQHKWLRWHGHQEWYDLWGDETSKIELLNFFDHFLLGKDNGWEATPRVRMASLKFGTQSPISDIRVKDFPLPDTHYRKAYLHGHGALSFGSPTLAAEQSLSYDSEDPNSFLSFRYTFDTATRLMGIPKAVLYMSAENTDDMDIFVILRKISKSGEPMLSLNIPWKGLPVDNIADIPDDKRTEVILYAGPTGMQRASLRAIDSTKSMHENWPFTPLDREDKPGQGCIVRLEIGIWAFGTDYEQGESIQLQVCGSLQGVSNFHDANGSKNKGKHVLHLGGCHDSHVVLPFV